ncbi:MAG TPA: ATP synthase F1 subunit gamma [Acidobacteriota bacterium]|nr:ATP synthase F1 subunit gamma [Acidobacteriota bacterium]
MPAGNLIDLRRRVRSVKNIRQITRAMKFVSASKLKRAQQRIEDARPYAKRMLHVLNSVAARVEGAPHPLLEERRGDRTMLVVVTSDKGLCGAFNTNIIRAAARYIESEELTESINLTLVGRKGVDWFKRRPWPIKHQYVNIMSQVDFKYAQEIARTLIDYYSDSKLDSVFLVYNEFKSVIQQEIIIEPLLPIQRLEGQEDEKGTGYIWEQPPDIVLDRLLPKHVETQIFRAMLESEAAEHGARMTAMDSATRNAKEVIEDLTLQANRLRQASITTEIIEIVSGAEALEQE